MEFFDVAESVAILFLLSVVGYLSFVAGVLDRPTTIKISRFVLNVALPALILASLQLPEGATLLGDLPGLVIAIVVFYAVSLVAAWVVPRILRIPSAKRGVFRFTLIFSNVAFMGFPIVESLFGRLGLAYAALFN
ncbi:MAG: AEC family transporter, partial [Methanobacteriota archaeon]